MLPVLIRREFTSRVKGTAYIITTLIGVLVFVALSFLPPLMEHFTQSMGPKRIELMVFEQTVDSSLYPYLLEISENQPRLQLRDGTNLDYTEAYRLVLEEGLTGLLMIDGPTYTLITPDGTNLSINGEIENFINRALTRANAVRLGLSEQDMETLFQRTELRIREIRPGGEGGTELDSIAHTQAMVLAYFLLFMIYMALIMYGNMVATGVAEEKSSRIMEVMISTVKPSELMLGKIIGVGTLGLLQFVIWMGTGFLMRTIGKAGLFGTMLGSTEAFSTLPLDTVLWFGLYFVLGYFFYASIFAAVGALVSRVEDVSQVTTLIMMFIMVGFFAAYLSFLNPNGSFAVVTSFIPFTAPMVMFARIVLANPPFFQIIVSVLVMLVSVFLGAWFSGKIYRVGILLYGKRPSLRQVLRLLQD